MSTFSVAGNEFYNNISNIANQISNLNTSDGRLKDDVKEIKEGFECGIGIDTFSKFKEGDIIVCYEIQSIKRKLEIN